MKNSYTSSKEIEGPVSGVWKLLTDFSRYPQWLPRCDRCQQLDEGEPGRGSLLQIRAAGRELEATVSYWEPEKSFAVVMRRTRSVTRLQFRLEPSQESTLLTATVELQTEGLATATALFLFPMYRRLIDDYLKQVRYHFTGIANH